MTEFIKKLKSANYTVGLLTNVTPTTEEEVCSHGGYEEFDFLIRSCKVGYAKPDPEIYTLAMKYFPSLRPDEVVFVDDNERFLVPARNLGMHVIRAQNAKQVITDITKLMKMN